MQESEKTFGNRAVKANFLFLDALISGRSIAGIIAGTTSQ
jgi:hypothetical protein